MFMSERDEARAIFTPVYGCNADDDSLVVELAFFDWQTYPDGGLICVREASGDRGMEFRYSPPNNTGKFC